MFFHKETPNRISGKRIFFYNSAIFSGFEADAVFPFRPPVFWKDDLAFKISSDAGLFLDPELVAGERSGERAKHFLPTGQRCLWRDREESKGQAVSELHMAYLPGFGDNPIAEDSFTGFFGDSCAGNLIHADFNLVSGQERVVG